MPIRILPPQVANQIAAGEVVERPASVIKELIENSLDAGATDIRVEIREGGRRLMRVQDDGCGIPTEETRLAFQRHATSKITSAEDLNHLTTLGFRGEALASIASVAQVTLLTRSRAEQVGTLVRVAGGRETTREPKGAPAGTTVTVEHLFANVPARLKFLKRPATEAGHIQQVITRYALAYPEHRFSLVNNGKLVFQSTGSGKLYDVLVKVYGLGMARQMLQLPEAHAVSEPQDTPPANTQRDRGELIDAAPDAPPPPNSSAPLPPGTPAPSAPLPRVTGYIGAPSLHRSNRSYITLFINRRWFQDRSIAYSVIQAYHTMLPVGRYPVAVIFIEMAPEDVDVNVHPTKAEVRFRDSHAVFSAVQRAVRQTLTEHAPIPPVGLGVSPQAAPARQMSWQGADAWSARREALLGAGRGLEKHALPPAGTTPAATAPSLRPELEPPAAPDLRPRLVPILRVIGQVAATYIVAEGPDGMYLIDQHAAHERILYEQMLAQHTGKTLATQALLEPLVLDLSPEQAAVVAEELETLNELGIAIEEFGSGSYLVRSIPAILSQEDPQGALTEIIDGLAGRTNLVEATQENRLVTMICKRAAVKGGQPLSMQEMQELVRQLEACRSPRTCPHGRPTMIYLSSAEMARQFGRT